MLGEQEVSLCRRAVRLLHVGFKDRGEHVNWT